MRVELYGCIGNIECSHPEKFFSVTLISESGFYLSHEGINQIILHGAEHQAIARSSP